MPSISKILKNFNFFALIYCTLIFNVSGSKSKGGCHDGEQSENPRKKTKSTRSAPISCVACDRVFFDNVSLCLHFQESHHIKEETPSLSIPSSSHHSNLVSQSSSFHSIPSPSTPSLSIPSSSHHSRRGGLFSQSSSSPVSRTSEAHHVESPSMNVLPTHTNSMRSPLVNSNPPLGERKRAPGLATLPTLPLNVANGSLPVSSVNSPNLIPKYVNMRLPPANFMPPLGARNCTPGLGALPTLPLNVANRYLPVRSAASPNIFPKNVNPMQLPLGAINSMPPSLARSFAPGLTTLPTLPLNVVNKSLPTRSVESATVSPKHDNLVQSPVTNFLPPLGARNGLPTLPSNMPNRSLPVHSLESPNVLPEHVNPVQLPVSNSMPPLRSRSSAPGLATLPTLPLNVTNGGKGRSLVRRSSRNRKFVRPSKEIILISDDEDEQIDLTLRL